MATEITIIDNTYSVNNIYYVSPDGSNDNDGLSEDTPLATYMYANSIASTGDAICFLPGDHVYDLKISELPAQSQSGGTYPVVMNDCLYAYKQRGLLIYSKLMKDTTITFNIDCTMEDGSTPRALYRMAGGIIANCHIKFIDNATEFYTGPTGNALMWIGAYGYYSSPVIYNSIIELNSALPITMYTNNHGGSTTVTQSTILNYGSYHSSVATGIYNCVFNSDPLNSSESGNTVNENVLITDELTESTLLSSYYYDDIEVGALLPVNYILKNNDNLYIINESNYDSESGMYVPIPSIDGVNIDELSVDKLTDEKEYLSGLRPIDKFSGTIELIVTFNSVNTKINGLKSNMELIVANDSIPLSIVDTINSVSLTYTASENGGVSIALSKDNGTTWLTYNSEVGSFEELNVTIPTTDYDSMSTKELEQWELAKETIYNNGIDASVFSTLDINLLKDDESGSFNDVRFAYVLARPSYSDSASTSVLNWDFNAKGHMKLMVPGTEYTTDVYDKHMVFTPLIDNPIIKVGYTFNVETSGTSTGGTNSGGGTCSCTGSDGKSAYETWLSLGNKGTEEDFINSLKGETGETGTNGSDGKSAYEIWLELGNEGTEQDFIDSLEGEEGGSGKSAYEVWLELGNTGSEEDFINSLKGADGEKGENGEDGKSAYEVWLDLGNTGSEEDFINSLRGKDGIDGMDGTDGKNGEDGTDGKSAYEIWLSLGNQGNEENFINSLKGKDGADGVNGANGTDGKNGVDGEDGKSAYDIWLELGNTGTEENFINSLKGKDGETGANGSDGESAYETWLSLGNEGTEEDFINSLKGSKGEDANSDFVFSVDENGILCVTYDDGVTE